MTAEQDKCGLTSLLSMSCRGRAEAFARRLHSRLKSLGSQDGVVDENSWLGGHENSVSLSQPHHSTESDLFLDFDLLESPGSPEDELPQPEFVALINNLDNNLSCRDDCECSKQNKLINNRLPSNDSDSSDGTYYDLDLENGQNIAAVNGIAESNGVDKTKETETESTKLEDIFESPASSESALCKIISDESVTSFQDEEYSSLDFPELSINEETANTDFSSATENGVDCVDFAKLNGNAQKDCNGEVYSSHLNIEKDLTIECPSAISEVTILPSVEVSPAVSEPLLNKTNGVEEEDDSELEGRTPRVRRCSSLKTGKTPPGTPGRKKIVRFADVLGLDLADVRTFLDEIPKIPTSAYDDLKDADLNEPSPDPLLSVSKFQFGLGAKPDRMLMVLFQQPGGMPDFLERVKENQVCLENALVTDPVNLSVSGTVRVRNLDFNKSVHVRYTLDSWKTFADLQAVYVQNSCDGFSDKFSFVLYANNLSVGQRLEFAIRFQCKGSQYWDSNKGANYCFQCLPATQNTSYTSVTGGNDWSASFY